MKKLLLFLLALALCLGYMSVNAEEDIYAVGGNTLEEAVQKIPGYQVFLNDDGSKTIVVTDLAREYYYDNSENGIAVMPNMVSMSNLNIHVIAFCWPTELTKVSKMIITTDNNIHTLIPNEPWIVADTGNIGNAIFANEQLETILFEMGKSENISIEFFKDNSTSKTYDLTMEQKYLLRQYIYACETFLPKPPADATTAFIMAIINNQASYKISTVRNPNSANVTPTTSNSPSTHSIKEELSELKAMLDEGLITQEDYNIKKKQLLGL